MFVVNCYKYREYRHDENLIKGEMSALMCIRLISGGREKGMRKDHGQSYQEPAQVPLGEKPKV